MRRGATPLPQLTLVIDDGSMRYVHTRYTKVAPESHSEPSSVVNDGKTLDTIPARCLKK